MFRDLRISFAGAGVRYVLQAFSMIVLSRLLSPEEFGVMAAAMIVVSFSFVVLQVGGAAIVASAPALEVDAAYTVSVISSVVASVLLYLLYLFFEHEVLLFLKVDSVFVIRTLMLAVLCRAVIGAIEGLLSARYEFKKIVEAEVYSYLFGYFLFSIIVGYLTRSYWALVFGVLAQSVFHLALLLKSTDVALKKIKLSHFKTHLPMGFGLVVNKIIGYGNSQVDNLYINTFVGQGELGLYSRAYQLMVIPTNFVGQVVGRVFVPRFRSEVKVYTKYQLVNAIGSVSIVALLIVVGEPLVLFLLGEQWVGVYDTLLVLALATYYRVDLKFVESVLIAKRENGRLATVNVSFLIAFSVCLFLYGAINIRDIAVCVFYATFVQGVLGGVIASKHLGANWFSVLTVNLIYFCLSLVILAEWA